MEKKILKEPMFIREIVALIKSEISSEKLIENLRNYHNKDIAQSLACLSKQERNRLYNVLGDEWISDILSYIDNPKNYINEISIEKLASLINEMDSDDAVDLLDSIDDSVKNKLRMILNEDVRADIQLIRSYHENEIGSLMTTNFICINHSFSIKQATKELIKQAGDNDNISTIYVIDKNKKYCGAIELKDLIVARESEKLEDLIAYSYPYLYADQHIDDCIDQLKDYAEDSLPVLNSSMEILGIITAQDIVELIANEMGDDYAKLGGLTSGEDLRETTKESMKKRLPWLIILLLLGMLVSTVVGIFEGVVAVLPIIICFQSLILDMAGNVGTQSLAVTIRVLMDENLNSKDKLFLVGKEIKVGFSNGLLLGILAVVCLGIYISVFKGYNLTEAFIVSGCVGISLLIAMLVSSLVGTLIPLFFNKIKIEIKTRYLIQFNAA